VTPQRKLPPHVLVQLAASHGAASVGFGFGDAGRSDWPLTRRAAASIATAAGDSVYP